MNPDRGSGGSDQPIVAIIAAPGTTASLRPLVAVLARRASVTAFGRGPQPDAVIATHPEVAGLLPPGRPGAVVDGDLLQILRADGRPDGEPLPLPGPHVVASAGLPPLAPHVRRRWRERLGLPTDLAVDTVALDRWDVPTALAVCAAAVVELRDLPMALALGCPTVTDAAAASAVGAQPDRDVVIGARSDAVALAEDADRAARLSRSAHALAVGHLDPEIVAAALLDRWGLALEPSPQAHVAALLTELGTAPGAPVRARAAEALALFNPSPVPA